MAAVQEVQWSVSIALRGFSQPACIVHLFVDASTGIFIIAEILLLPFSAIIELNRDWNERTLDSNN